MIHGVCDCGRVGWTFAGVPTSATACNCRICRRYGALWAYDIKAEAITVSGETQGYTRGEETLAFQFCPTCGCVAYWRGLKPDKDGRRRIAVNLRMAEPKDIAAIPIRHLDGLETFKPVARDTACVADLWF